VAIPITDQRLMCFFHRLSFERR